MRACIPALRRVILTMVALLVIPARIMAQDEGDSDQAYHFSKEELTQMVAPIALYPDALTAQILMASTYPLEVVEAERWRSKNLQLKGDDLDNALQDKNWAPSIKSICHFPDILTAMSEKLDQTRKLGDAFLGQEAEVMATIQELRSKALEHGTLNTTNEQKVIVEKEIIRIEPANPEVVYVPVYDPAYVYGPWWYPSYPPYYWYYPPGFYSGAYIGFGPGIFFGFNAFSWAWFDWPFYRVRIDINRTRSFHHYTRRDDYYGRRGGTPNVWRHNPQHRRGVAYRDLRTSERFGSRTPRSFVSSPSDRERRGYPGTRMEQQNVRQQRGVRQAVPQTPQTPTVRQAPSAGTSAPAIRREGSPTPRVQSLPDRSQRGVVRDTPFRGVGEGSFERRAAERGGISNRSINRSSEIRQPTGGSSQRGISGGGFSRGGGSGGAVRGGGGGHGGGGGGRTGGSRR